MAGLDTQGQGPCARPDDHGTLAGPAQPWPGSATWRYLHGTCHIPEPVIRKAIATNVLREGPKGSMWAGHTDHASQVTGWEERVPIGAASRPEAPRCCSVSAGPMGTGSALPRRRSMP
ncbi:DUF3991 domain-containing protein [Chelativorans intermedius]|uniref:DUF3991 domain-containing protein n=1 Tax=Chelativorans intermedius TaxID=515947 RepID=A0ABV6DDC0_9HYPH